MPRFNWLNELDLDEPEGPPGHTPCVCGHRYDDHDSLCAPYGVCEATDCDCEEFTQAEPELAA